MDRKKLTGLISAAVLVMVLVAIIVFSKGGKTEDNTSAESSGIEIITKTPDSAAKDTPAAETSAEADNSADTGNNQSSSASQDTPAADTPADTEAPTVTDTPALTATDTPAPTATDTPTPTEVVTEQYYFRSQKLLKQHYEKHGIEMGFADASEYEAAASAVVTNPSALHKTEAEDGDDIYYIEETNEFVVVSTDGYIRTYFNPSGGKAYYDRQ